MADNLKNIPAVVQHLSDAGWKISTSGAYKHKKEGKLRPGDDGSFAIAEVEKYARQWLATKDGSTPSADVLQKERAEAELQKTRAQAQHWETKTRLELGELVPRADWDRELSARAMVFKGDMLNFIHSEASEIIRLVDGSLDKAPDLIDYYLQQAEAWLDRYSKEKTWGKAE